MIDFRRPRIPWNKDEVVLDFREEIKDYPFLNIPDIPPGFKKDLERGLLELNDKLEEMSRGYDKARTGHISVKKGAGKDRGKD